jgi:2-haloacid dehalogenase
METRPKVPSPFPGRPTVLVFDVHETLIDIESISPLFERVFGDRRVMREWLRHLIMYSMSLTLSVSMRTSGP